MRRAVIYMQSHRRGILRANDKFLKENKFRGFVTCVHDMIQVCGVVGNAGLSLEMRRLGVSTYALSSIVKK
jgi:hypothetical protein